MNPELPQKPQDELESSLTALLLGELPHEQAAALHQKLAQDAELAKLYERLKHTINLVRETLATPAAQTADQPTPLRLSDQRRQKLLQHFKTVVPKEFVPPRRRAMPWLVPVGIAAALVALMAVALLPTLSRPKSRSIGRSFGTWSLSESVATAPAPAVATESSSEMAHLKDAQAERNVAVKELPQQIGEVAPPAAVSVTARPAGSAIVLPKATELAYADTTPAVAEGGQPGFDASANTRGLYDDPSGQAGGMMGGGGSGGGGFGGGGMGGPGGGVRGEAFAADGQQKGPAAAVKGFRIYAYGTPLQSPAVADNSSQTLEYKADGIVPTFGPDGKPLPSAPQSQELAFRRWYERAPEAAKDTGASSPARQYPNNSTIGDAYFFTDPETRRVANMEAPPPAAVPALSATLAPAQEALGKAAASHSATGPAPAQAKPALVEQRSTVAGVPLQLLADNKVAGDLTARLRTLAPSQPAPDVSKAGELILNSDVPGLISSNQRDQKALGFDLYARNALVNNGRIGGQAGTAPSGTDQALIQGQEHMLPPPSEPTAAPNGTVPLAIKLPVPAFKGLPTDVPVLGDVPVAGGLFRPTPGAAGANVEANSGAFAAGQKKYDISTLGVARGQTEGRAKSVESADHDSERLRRASEGEAGRQVNRGANVLGLGGVGHVNAPITATNAFAGFPAEPSAVERYTYNRKLSELSTDASGASRPARSPIVLPGEPSETGLALKEGEGRDKKQIAAGAMQLKVEEKPKSVELLAKLDVVASGAEKLHDEFQIADGVAGVPTTPMTAEGLDELERQRPEGDAKTQHYFEAKRELDESQRSRQILDMKIASEKIDVDLPKTSMVEIVDKAAPASSPSSTLWEKIRGKGGDFKSTARIKVERDQSDIAGLADGRQGAGYDPYFVQTESEAIQSEAVLGKVIKDLNLNEEWGKKQGGRTLTTAETMALLKNKLDLRPVQNSSLLEIGVKSDKPDEAARIANAVAEEYKARRTEQRMQLSKRGIKALEEQYAKQEEKVREAQKKVDELRRELSIRDSTASGEKSSPATAADTTPPKSTAPAAIPQPEVQTADNAFSTFSLNVSDVSFKLAAASLEKGVMPEPATMRSEEFINAFDYRDPEPPPGVPVAFAWERAQYPFAQNRDLLRFSIKTAALGRQPGRPLNLVLLLDNSGSMERADRVRIIHEALRVLAGQLQPQDKFSVVTFARTAHLWVDGVPGNQAAQVAEEVSGLTPQGGTNLEDAMNLGYQTALRHYLANGINRVVLLTDGTANLGNVDPEALKQKVEANRKQGIALDCFGIGWEGYNDDLLEVLTRTGDGRYGFVNTPEEAATEFAGQLAGALHVAASDVKVQVEFNPARVTAYRQIGYAKHQLTKEQFRDNTVNAAQIGAAESGNALYVVEVNPAGDGPLAIVRVRYRVPGTTDYHEHEWPVPYTGNAVALEQASLAMRLAATASAFSEWLVASPYAGEVSPDRLLGYLGGVPEVYGADARPKKLEWMIRQAKSIAGK
jgi:anti-sigma factor RsiW